MRIYRKGNKYVMCSEWHRRHYEKNYAFDESWEINTPRIAGVKAAKPYDGVSITALKNHISQCIKGHENMIRQLKQLQQTLEKKE